jgi:hypothetical protein
VTYRDASGAVASQPLDAEMQAASLFDAVRDLY